MIHFLHFFFVGGSISVFPLKDLEGESDDLWTECVILVLRKQ